MNLNKLLGLSLLLLATNSQAQQPATFSGVISDIGCHQVDGTCFVEIQDFGAQAVNVNSGCTASGSLRWDNAHTENGRRTYDSLLKAFEMSATVSVTVGGCTAQGFPALLWYHIKK